MCTRHCPRTFFGGGCQSYNMNFDFLAKCNDFGGRVGWGSVGTALFFMISGAGLIYNYEGEDLDIRRFYFKRFLKMLPALYFTHIVVFIILSIIQDSLLYKITVRSVFLTLQGKALVGEWFTPVILFCYVLFPLMKILYERKKILTTLFFTLGFMINQKFKLFTLGSQWASYVNGIYAFWIGMLIIGYRKKLSIKILPMLMVFLISIPLWGKYISLEGMWYYMPTILCASTLFTMMLYTNINNHIVNKISSYSYEIYLIHHQIMYITFPIISTVAKTQKQYMLFFVVLLFVTYCFAEKLNMLNRKFIDRVSMNMKRLDRK